MNRPIDPDAGLSDMEKFARQTAEATKADQRRRSSSGDQKKGGKVRLGRCVQMPRQSV